MPGSIDASLVRIRTTDGNVVGAGFLVGERQVLTCTHVIAQALDLAGDSSALPLSTVVLDFPLLAPRLRLAARVVLWCPVQEDGSGDIAGLELLGDPPTGAEAVRFTPAEDVWEHPFRAFGFPDGHDDGVWATGRLLGRQATNWILIEDVKTEGFAVIQGFSGGPVWDTHLRGVVGMVVAASRRAETKTAFVIPFEVLVSAWPLIEPVARQRIFLSAAPADVTFAERLRADLQAHGVVVWNESHGPIDTIIDPQKRVQQAIRAAQSVVLVVSPQTRSSRTVKEHLHLTNLYQRRLILVQVGNDEQASPQLLGWQETVMVDARTTPYETILMTIETALGQRQPPPSETIPETPPRNPYKGLHAFTANDAGDFFGRDRLVHELVKDVATVLVAGPSATDSGRLLTIIGPSGSGKSSVVMAGLLPQLRDGALPGSDAWVYLEPIVPGKHPIDALILTLKPHFPDTSFKTLREDLEDDTTNGLHLLATQLVTKKGARVVLLVDQLEEIFTQTETENEREQFLELLLTAATTPDGPLLVLLTLRADFYHRLMEYPALYHLVQPALKPLLPLEVEDLRATIEQPAALPDVQLSFEGNLVGDLLFEMQGQMGALPLLQFALYQLFERRNGHRLTLQSYREIGGVKGALSQHSEKTYRELPSDEHHRLARTLFLRLLEPGASEQDTTRRRAALSEFVFENQAQNRLMQETIAAFVAARLLTTNEIAGTTTVEVSHEAVIREWKRLAEWLRDARDDIHLQKAISADVTEWNRRKQPKDRLYRGVQLKEAQAWAKRNTPSSNEAAFLRASRGYQLRSRVTFTSLVLLLLLAAGVVATLIQSSHPSPAPVILVLDPKSEILDPKNPACSGGPVNRTSTSTCTVTLGESQTSEGDVRWSASSDMDSVTFSPANGHLSPGKRASVTISAIPCQNGSFVFSETSGANVALVLWHCIASSTGRRLDFRYQEFTLTVGDPGALLRGSSQDNNIRAQLLSQPWLQGRSVGLAIASAGAPTTDDISQAQNVARKIYSIMSSLSPFRDASYYEALYFLGDPANTVTIDVYLFVG